MNEIEPFDPINGTHIPNREKFSKVAIRKAISMGDVNKCLVCGKRTAIFKGSKSKVEFARFCCQECRMINRKLHKGEIIEKRKATNLSKFGYENPFSSPTTRDSIKQTNLKKYGAGKLLKFAMKENGWNHVISWSDNRFSNGKMYEKIGMTLEEELGPDYSYWSILDDTIRSKQSCQKKNIGCTPGQTERDRALELGLFRIWDCGKRRWGIKV